MTNNVIIRTEKLRKAYRREEYEVVALNNVDLDIPHGDFLALMGPSGSGKSTLLHLIAGIDKPTAGKVTVLGEDLGRFSDKQMAHWRSENVGYVFQTFNLIPVLTALENIELPLLLTNLNKTQRREHARTALDIVGLADRMEHYPRQLSGGQEQRVAIARAIVTDPAIILADEPTGDLDATSAKDVLTILSKLNQQHEKTIIMVTHDPNAAKYARRTLYLEKGDLLDGGQLPEAWLCLMFLRSMKGQRVPEPSCLTAMPAK